jgi:hypothetical protein
VSNELLLAGVVRKWAEEVWPAEPAAAEGAVTVAMRCYAGGASVSESCREARGFLRGWARHPSHARLSQEEPLVIAS